MTDCVRHSSARNDGIGGEMTRGILSQNSDGVGDVHFIHHFPLQKLCPFAFHFYIAHHLMQFYPSLWLIPMVVVAKYVMVDKNLPHDRRDYHVLVSIMRQCQYYTQWSQ